MTGFGDGNGPLLAATLAVAVPMWIERARGWSAEERARVARECAGVVASQGDIILFRCGKKGTTAAAFNALAKGLAVLAFAPGGVKAFGSHWEARDT